jgi:hypothetical protein
MKNVTDRDALLYLAGAFEAVAVGPRYSDMQLAGVLLLYQNVAPDEDVAWSVAAAFLARNEASDVPERRDLAGRFKDIIARPEKLR